MTNRLCSGKVFVASCAGRVGLSVAVIALACLVGGPRMAYAADPTVAATPGNVGGASGDAYVRAEANRWTLGTASVEEVLALEDGRLLLKSFKNKQSNREMIPKGRPFVCLPPQGWKFDDAAIATLRQGELQFDLTLSSGSLQWTETHVIYPGTSVIRQWHTIKNIGSEPQKIANPPILSMAACLGASAGALDFHWMTGAHNEPGSWMLKTEKVNPRQPRQFDSYDPFPPRGGPSPNDQRMGSESYAPWYALYDRESKDGLVIGWDYMGHWTSRFEAEEDGNIFVRLHLAGFHQMLKPGETITTPKALVAVFREDLDNAGNELLDWQYRYLWDYTRDGWFPALPMLGYWHKGTGWGEPGAPWWGTGRSDTSSQFTKIFRMADLIRQVGADNYHRDWGWWDRAGDWNGPDFGASGKYLAKSGMGQIIYAFLYTADPQSKLAQAHPDWFIGETLDMSKPEVVAHMQWQLDDFHARWGDFAWRNDSTPTAPRGDDDTGLLAQDQNFRKIIQSFLDKYPRSSFQSVNGGGNEAGYDYLRLSGMFQFSDGVIGPLRTYYASLLFPPDKLMDNGDQWNPDQYDKAKWRGLLSMGIMTTGDTWDKAKLEGVRELFDIYRYLAGQGVVGRWVRVYRPIIDGDDPTMYLERLSQDRLRGLIIPARQAPGKVLIKPKGLLADAKYRVTFQESQFDEERTGAEWMDRGISIGQMTPGELIYLNLPLHPGSKLDQEPPKAPSEIVKRRAENMGYPGIELAWKPAIDNNWVSYYQILRDGRVIDTVAKGTFAFDHAAGADLAARYEVRAVDGAGNLSPLAAAKGPEAKPCQVLDDVDAAMKFMGDWRHDRGLQPAHLETITSSDEKGATIEATFEGRRILWFSKLGDDCGKAGVAIDDGPVEVVDTYCSDDVWGVCLFRKELPVPGKHRMKITVLGEHNPRAKGNRVHLDGIRAEPE